MVRVTRHRCAPPLRRARSELLRAASLRQTRCRVWAGHDQTKNPAFAGSLVWCSIVDALQTSALENYNNPKLKHLVEVFNLSGQIV